MHMLSCIIFPLHHATPNAGLCLSVASTCAVSCLLAWHLEPIVMKVMSVQVHAKSTGHVEAVQMIDDPQQLVHCKCGRPAVFQA